MRCTGTGVTQVLTIHYTTQYNKKQRESIMKKTIKALLCAVSAIAICASPTVANYAGISEPVSITAEAAKSDIWNYEVIDNTSCRITGYSGTSNCISIPSKIGNRTVTEIGYRAFGNSNTLTSVTLPKTIKSIGLEAFNNGNITSVTLYSEDEKIFNPKWGAFYSTSLENINIKNSKIFDKLLENEAISGADALIKINNKSIYTNNEYGEPVLQDLCKEGVYKYFDILEKDNIKFFEKYFKDLRYYYANSVTANCKTNFQKVKALHDWLCDKVDYALTENGAPVGDWVAHRDSSAFFRNEVVCDGYARALTLLCREVGIEAYRVQGYGHAWTMVKLDKLYFHIDATSDDAYGKGNRGYKRFLVSDDDLRFGGGDEYKTWYLTNKMLPSDPPTSMNYVLPQTTPVCSVTIGDVNEDGSINNADVDAILNYVCNRTKYKIKHPELADLDNNPGITAYDASVLRQRIKTGKWQ